MKAILEFNDEERHELRLAINADLIYATLWDASQEIRKLLKHREDLEFREDQYQAIQNIQSLMSETIYKIDEL
tara:strand:+ start:54 stop:272 length:219 start_codon:yes stop_codon:yes gene_type:complete